MKKTLALLLLCLRDHVKGNYDSKDNSHYLDWRPVKEAR